MKITLLCNSPAHPVNRWLEKWQEQHAGDHDVVLCRDRKELPGGDILFLVSCSQIIDARTRMLYRHTLVLHASDLPKGRGWSPHVWELLNGAETITVSLLDAEDDVDTGAIWAKRTFPVPKHALHDEINERLFDTELALMHEALLLFDAGARPTPQPKNVSPSYYPKRCPDDSEIDPRLPLDEVFNAIRLMDPERYPAYFQLHGHCYAIQLRKVHCNEDHHD
jgi:methionyl-tRNA formyltransferase